MDDVDIINIEDPSVYELLNKTAKELRTKYFQQREVKEKMLNKKSPIKKILNVVLDIVCVFCLLIGFVVTFSTINTSMHGYLPNFIGYSNMVISSSSMEASGYYVGDIVIVHSVDVKTLDVGDKIVFYQYSPSYVFADTSSFKMIESPNVDAKQTLTVPQLFGFQSKEKQIASQKNSRIIFHHIHSIYEDENGERWFQTYGSSNGGKVDSWWINEKYVIGIEDEGVFSKSMKGIVEITSSSWGLLFLLVPAGILIVLLVLSFMKMFQVAKLELDCVEEKRKITDEICVRNDVGYQMSTKTKYKILAQATEENKQEYINLLWKKGKIPNGIKKYYLRRKLLLSTNKDLLSLNRECETMFKNGKNPTNIAKHYLSEKEKIEERAEKVQKRVENISRLKSKKK